jgi:hypothetical protein
MSWKLKGASRDRPTLTHQFSFVCKSVKSRERN